MELTLEQKRMILNRFQSPVITQQGEMCWEQVCTICGGEADEGTKEYNSRAIHKGNCPAQKFLIYLVEKLFKVELEVSSVTIESVTFRCLQDEDETCQCVDAKSLPHILRGQFITWSRGITIPIYPDHEGDWVYPWDMADFLNGRPVTD